MFKQRGNPGNASLQAQSRQSLVMFNNVPQSPILAPAKDTAEWQQCRLEDLSTTVWSIASEICNQSSCYGQ
jgi:hypothetical protein